MYNSLVYTIILFSILFLILADENTNIKPQQKRPPAPVFDPTKVKEKAIQGDPDSCFIMGTVCSLHISPIWNLFIYLFSLNRIIFMVLESKMGDPVRGLFNGS